MFQLSSLLEAREKGEGPGKSEIPAPSKRETAIPLVPNKAGNRKTILLLSLSSFFSALLTAIVFTMFSGGSTKAPVQAMTVKAKVVQAKTVQAKKVVNEIHVVAEKKVIPVSNKPAAAETAAPVCGSVSDPSSAGEMLKRCIEAYNAAS